MRRFLSLLRSTCLWVLLVPQLFLYGGTISNQLVLWANRDTFPVLMRDNIASRALPDEDGHVLMTKDTHLNFLGDIFDFHNGWMSIGDLSLDAGIWMSGVAPYIYIVLVTRKLLDNSAKK